MYTTTRTVNFFHQYSLVYVSFGMIQTPHIWCARTDYLAVDHVLLWMLHSK